MNFRPYQPPAIKWLSTRAWGAVIAPAGSGKTIIAAGTLDRVVRAKPRRAKSVRVGWLANTVEQCGQAKDAIRLFPGMDYAIDVKIACAAANTDWSDRDVLIVDECHHCGTAAQWISQIETCRGARWGFTATPPEDPDALSQMLSLFNNEQYVIDRAQVSGHLAAARVVLHNDTDDCGAIIDYNIDREFKRRQRWWEQAEVKRLNAILLSHEASPMKKADAENALETIWRKLWGQVAFQTIVKLGIVGNRCRSERAIQLALKHRNDSVLMLVNQVEHGKELAERIPGAIACYSQMGKKKRAAALESFRQRKCRCLIATSLADEGLDLPMANVLVLVSGGRSNRTTEQRTGRVLREFANKTEGVIHDFKDMFHPLAAKHSRVRQELYKKLGYKIDL